MNIKQFVKLELSGWKKIEIVGLISVLFIIFINAFLMNDSYVAVVSAVCGILYTFIAGKGKISCYLFGITGSSFYGYLAFHNALYGNLLLYMGYYLPMQVLGIFKWKNHLKKTTNEIEKTKLEKPELIRLTVITLLACLGSVFLLTYFKDGSPVIDGVTTVLSILGMYLTVKRCIEQWIVWMIVNGLSVLMWSNIVIQGEKAYSTVIMWAVYFILAVYFYIQWKKELSLQ